MPATFSQQDTAALLARRIQRLRDEARALAALDQRTLTTTPPAGGWSVAQVLEHLAVSNHDYLRLVESLMARGRALAPAGADAAWRPRLIAGFLWRSLEKEGNRLPAPRQIRPAATPAPGVLERYERSLTRYAGLLPQAASLPWNALVGPSPISRLVRPNLGDALMIVVTHCERHHRQVGRVRAALAAAPARG